MLYSGLWHLVMSKTGTIITIFWGVALYSSVSRYHHYHILGCGTV